MSWPKSIPIELTQDERLTLQSTVARAKSLQRDVFRAKIILKAAQGISNRSIAKELRTIPKIVRIWRRRFIQYRLPGLQDQPRSGRPVTFSL